MKVNQIVALGVELSKCLIHDEVAGAKSTESEIILYGVDRAILKRRVKFNPRIEVLQTRLLAASPPAVVKHKTESKLKVKVGIRGINQAQRE